MACYKYAIARMAFSNTVNPVISDIRKGKELHLFTF